MSLDCNNDRYKNYISFFPQYLTKLISNFNLQLQVQNAALGALKDEVLDLSTKVKRIGKERDYLEKELNTSQVCSNQFIKYCCIHC